MPDLEDSNDWEQFVKENQEDNSKKFEDLIDVLPVDFRDKMSALRIAFCVKIGYLRKGGFGCFSRNQWTEEAIDKAQKWLEELECLE